MAKEFLSTRQQRQVGALLVLGIVLLLAAWLVHPSSAQYPVGVFLLGAGMLVSSLLNPHRLIIASSLTTAIGVAVFLGFKGLIPGSQVFPAYILALGIGLLVIALAARRGYVGKGALSPACIVIGVGLIEVLLVGRLTPPGLVPFALSLWLPALGLLLLGVIYLVADRSSK